MDKMLEVIYIKIEYPDWYTFQTNLSSEEEEFRDQRLCLANLFLNIG